MTFDFNQLREFSLSHDRPELFRVSQCGDRQQVPAWYLCYRVVLALTGTSAFLVVLIMDSSLHWWIYLSNQSMLLLVIHLLLDMTLAIRAFIKLRRGQKLR